MKNLATTKISSKGQVVIPEIIRKQMGVHEGDQFIVLANHDVIILKVITKPSFEEFDHLITEARKQARQAGLKKAHLKAAIKRARREA